MSTYLSCIPLDGDIPIVSPDINEMQGVICISRTCDASEDGIDCQAIASHTYLVNATCWLGYPSVERHLCDYHFKKLLRLYLVMRGVEKLEGDVA